VSDIDLMECIVPQKPDLLNNPETKQWQKALLPLNATLEQAIKRLDETGLQIILVVSSDCKLLGTLTDGDIRRSLMNNFDTNSSIETIVQQEPLVVPAELSRDIVLQLMHANQVHQVPIVDENGYVLGLHLWDEIIAPQQRSNPMLIMAGGQGARLRPYTEKCPKPMLLIGGKPILEHIIIGAKGEGFHNFIIAVHYLGNMIEEYFGNGSSLNVCIEYLHEESPLGTAGAMSLLNPRPELPFVISNGDVLTDIRYGDILDYHCKHGALATMAVRMYEWQNPFGVVHTQGIDIMGFEEKPIVRNHINAGVYVLDSEVLETLKTGERCDMPTLFSRVQGSEGRAIVYPMHEPWLDIGRMDDFEQAQQNQQKKS
jgi:dTDP-glucose pyrophosphorylase